MDQYDFIKLFSAMLLETENPYFRKKDLGRFLYEHYDDPEYNSVLSSFAIKEDDEILGNYIVDLDFPTLILARSEFLTIVDLIDLTFIGNYSITEIKEQIKKDSLCYLPIIYSLLDNYLAIDFNHSKSK